MQSYKPKVSADNLLNTFKCGPAHELPTSDSHKVLMSLFVHVTPLNSMIREATCLYIEGKFE